MKQLKLLSIFLMALLFALDAAAQKTTVSGNVTDESGTEVIGATVTVKGSKGVGAVTDLDGNFSLAVNDAANDVLVVSYVGMKSQEIRLKGRRNISVKLVENAISMEDVVVVGYATVKRKDLTGSVSSVKSDELLKVPTGNISQALSGRIAGVMVNQSDGELGSGISIRVRGGISITQSNEPLYVIDGFPTEDGLSSLDPAEIETIDVLKDASATAIYGARGANGVIVVTTKQGASNTKATINFDSYVGWRKIANKLDMLSTKEFVLADYERTLGGLTGTQTMDSWISDYGTFADLDRNYANRSGIDWQKETLGRTTFVQNYRLSVSGGGKATQYNASYNFFRDEGAMVFSGMKKHDMVVSMKTKINDKLTFNARATFDIQKIWGSGTAGNGTGGGSSSDARFNKMSHILQYRPTVGILGNDIDLLNGEDPILADDSGNVMQNPLISAREETNDREYRTFNINGGLTYNILKGLSFRNTTGYRYSTQRRGIFYGDESMTARRSSINGSIANYETETFQTSNVLTYNTSIQKAHDLTFMLGQEFVNRNSRNFSGAADHFPNDEIGLADMSLGTPTSITSNQNYDDKLISFFTRVNYNYKDLYLISASLRADGSSKFGKDNKWGWFPAVSAAWRAGEEKFIRDLNIFSDLKFRIGYGLAGNNRIGSYNSLAILNSVFTAFGDGLVSGYASNQIPNPSLKWEANKTFNVGVDLGFFNQRLTITPEFYINKSSNLLLNAKLPESSGYKSMMINAGRTRNTGIDLTINSVNFANSNFSWKTALTLSHNKNKVEELTGEEIQLYEARFGYNQSTHRIAVGEPLGQFYGYKTIGIYTADDFDGYDASRDVYLLKEGVPYRGNKINMKPGMWKFADLKADGVIDENDKTVIGNASPDLYGGVNNTFSWGGFDLSVYFTYSIGNDVLNATKLINSRVGMKNKNSLDAVNSQNRWMTIDGNGNIVTDLAALAQLNAGKTVAAYYDGFEGNTYIHSWGVEDASYLKLSNITLGYTLPSRLVKHLGIRKLRFYVTGNNLWTFTNYTGYDPEVSTMASTLTPGVDFGSYPRSRSFIVGLNVSF